MANYTIELRHVIERKPIFNFDYEFYDEKKRADFERDFIRRFYFREIGAETIDRFIHNLNDKMVTVFPYYNKLFEAAKIEYSVLDNYNLKETTTTKRENEEYSGGVSSTVGQVFDDQTSSNTESRISNSEEEGESTTHNTRTDETENLSEKTGTETTNKSATDTSDKTKTSNISRTKEESENQTKEESKNNKFLDTPQGKLTLADAKYLTELREETSTDTLDKEGNATETETQTDTENGALERTEDGTLTFDTQVKTTGRGLTEDNGNTTNKNTGESSENTTAQGTFKGEQKSTQDNNTRVNTKGTQIETIELSKRGNIGIDTDSDMIQKHIKLQKILTNIKNMFFDECEDLFMMVW